MKNRIPVIVDEMNVVHQYLNLNVVHMSWTSFFSSIKHITKCDVVPYFACANVSNDSSFQKGRKHFFEALKMRGVSVLEGFSVLDSRNKRLEKGVDVLVALQIYKEALSGAKDIIVCSADSDLVPAILDAQSLGARVHVVVSDSMPAREITNVADRVISLEDVLTNVVDRGHVRFKDESKPFLIRKEKYYNKLRIGLVTA